VRDGRTLKPSYYAALKRLTLELAGVNLGSDHAFLVETRLASLARQEGYGSLTDMIDELFSYGKTRLAVQIVSALLERDTHFFNDREGFDHLENKVLPSLYAQNRGGTIRILSFGCSNGQEAYSLAIMLDRIKDRFSGVRFEIVGVDYPSIALERAMAGRYTHFEAQRGLPIRDLITYFDRQGEDWLVKPPLRKQIEFKEFHLLSSLDDLGTFQVVMFRNSLPHYSSPAQVRVLRSLSVVVEPLGFLMLGTGETLNHINYGFDPLALTPGVFRRRAPKPKIDEPEDDPNVKKPSGHTTFEGSRQRRMG